MEHPGSDGEVVFRKGRPRMDILRRSHSGDSCAKMGGALLTRAMEERHQIGLDSYDRFFPNQDTMPKGGFGNLIALPL